MKKRIIRILVIIFTLAFFFSFIQTRPYVVKHSTVFTYDDTIEMELYIVTNRFFIVQPDAYSKKIIRKHLAINKLSGNVSYRLILYSNNWSYKRDRSFAEYRYEVKDSIISKSKTTY